MNLPASASHLPSAATRWLPPVLVEAGHDWHAVISSMLSSAPQALTPAAVLIPVLEHRREGIGDATIVIDNTEYLHTVLAIRSQIDPPLFDLFDHLSYPGNGYPPMPYDIQRQIWVMTES